MSKQNRKTFYLDKEKEKPVTAGGVLLYRFIKKNMELLLVEGRGVYEDLGGRVDDNDKDIYATVAREASEESNSLLNKSKIKKRLKVAQYVYMTKCKYVIYIIKADENEEKLVSNDFGEKEKHDDVFRTVKWIPVDTFLLPDIIRHKLNFRLKSKALFDKLKEIVNDKKLDANMLSDSSKNINSTSEDESKDEQLEKKPLKKKSIKSIF